MPLLGWAPEHTTDNWSPADETNLTVRNANATGRPGEHLRRGGMRREQQLLLEIDLDTRDDSDLVLDDADLDDVEKAQVETGLLSLIPPGSRSAGSRRS